MAVDYTTTALLASVKRRAMVPSNSEALSDSDLLELANDALFTTVVPEMMRARSEFFVTEVDVSVVADTAAYDIPERAIGAKLRWVKTSDGSGGYSDVPLIEPERADEFANVGSPTVYYVQANRIVLVPTPSASSTLRLGYYRRPNRLIATSSCATVSSYDSGTTTITTTGTVPATFTDGVDVDVISHTAPGFDTRGDSVALSSPSGTSAPLATAPDSTPVAGDYVCLAGESPVAQIPVELHPWLVQVTIARVLEALGLQDKQSAAEATAEAMRVRLISTIAPRVDGAPRVVVNRNAPGFFRATSGYRWR